LNDDFAFDFRRRDMELHRLSSSPKMDPVTARLWEDHSSRILPGLFQYGDAVSMAHGVETRQPFMDYRIVNWLFSRDSSIKLRAGWTKWVLRQYLKLRGQERVAMRLQKIGYQTPVESWMAGKEADFIKDYLTGPQSRIREYCDPARINRVLRRQASGGYASGNHVYRLLSTETWLRACM
jgi:asparagine synthase (glutamine-hydrolysing)